MENLNQKRNENKAKERQQINLLNRFEIEKQRQFDNAMAGDELLYIQFLNDLEINCNKLNEWHGKTPKDDHKKTLFEMIKALWRVQNYTETLKTLSKKSISEYLNEKRMHHRAIRELEKLKRENMALKKEIEHYENE